MKSKILVFLLVSSFMLVGATSSAFAAPVDVYLGGPGPDSYPDYFRDAEKNKFAADDPYCWAASASNVLAWTGWDAGFSDEDAIFSNYQTNWTAAGSWARFGWEWWFTGSVTSDTAWNFSQTDGWSTYTGGGGYYSQAQYNTNVMLWEDLSATPDLSVADDKIMEFIDGNYATGLSILRYLPTGNKGHGITLWGYRYDDETGDIIGIHVSDSDSRESEWPPGTPLNDLDYYDLTFNTTYNCWYLSGYTDYDWWISSMGGLLPYDEEPGLEPGPGPGPGEPVPEPATIFLLGSGLAGLFGIGRRKFKRS